MVIFKIQYNFTNTEVQEMELGSEKGDDSEYEKNKELKTAEDDDSDIKDDSEIEGKKHKSDATLLIFRKLDMNGKDEEIWIVLDSYIDVKVIYTDDSSKRLCKIKEKSLIFSVGNDTNLSEGQFFKEELGTFRKLTVIMKPKKSRYQNFKKSSLKSYF
uniref:TFIIIC_sub6 domain-containing protein n=1 Tax=Rhabditophanes sp. KR3021 TaxID=114890 RepID=A0AC35TWH0_9BILA